MLLQSGLFSAFAIGLLGSVHCVGMCGGIVGALTLGLPRRIRDSGVRMSAYLVAYNLGRISSYTLAGLIAGYAGTRFYSLASVESAPRIAQWVSGIFMIALGTYLAGWTRVLAPVERAGAVLWRRIEPLGRRFLPVRHPWQALALGLLWGWLPCGLVYSALVLAFAGGEPLRGGLFMLAFGLGTVPMMLAMGAASGWLGSLVRRHWVRRVAGAVVIVFGVLAIFAPQVLHPV